MPVQACIVSCGDGAVECDLALLLLRHSSGLKEMFSDITCLCTKSVLLLPDQSVDTVALALNLLLGATGEVVIEESLLPATPVFALLGIAYCYDMKVGLIGQSYSMF